MRTCVCVCVRVCVCVCVREREREKVCVHVSVRISACVVRLGRGNNVFTCFLVRPSFSSASAAADGERPCGSGISLLRVSRFFGADINQSWSAYDAQWWYVNMP